MISYKYNIYHSKKTKYLDKMLRECCFVWNHALALQRRYYKLFGKYISVGKESMGNSGCRNAGVPYVCIQESHSL